MPLYLIALIVGIVAGMRAFVAPAAVAWAAWAGSLVLVGSWAAFMTSLWAPGVFSVLTLVEFVTDQLPKTPSRKVPQQFIPRVFSGAFSGAVIGASMGATVVGLVLGAAGAVIGTFGGYELRAGLAKTFGKDWPAAVIEDVLAVLIAAVVVSLI